MAVKFGLNKKLEQYGCNISGINSKKEGFRMS